MAGSLGGGITLDELTADAVEFDNDGTGLQSTEVRSAILEVLNKANSAIFPISILYNGTATGNFFMSYSNLTPNSPMIVAVNANLVAMSFSNSNQNADYTLNFRNNTNIGLPFYSITKSGVKSFSQAIPAETFNAGDFISLEYMDDGNNGQDIVIQLYFTVITGV